MPSSDFVDLIHRASRIPLGQSAKALVWRWRQICPLKIDIFTLSAPNSTNEVSMFKLAIEVCFENHFGFDSRYILIARVDQIRILFFGTPGTCTHPRVIISREENKGKSCLVFSLVFAGFLRCYCVIVH